MNEGMICLKDLKDTIYIFKKSSKLIEVYINGEFQGNGSLLTPIEKLALMKYACFKIGNNSFRTDPLKGIMFERA